MQFNALKNFLGGSAPKNPAGGIGGSEDPPPPQIPELYLGALTLAFPTEAWQLQL